MRDGSYICYGTSGPYALHFKQGFWVAYSGGFVVDPSSGQPQNEETRQFLIETGVSLDDVADDPMSVALDFIESTKKLDELGDSYTFGVWTDPETGILYVDHNRWFLPAQEAEAIRFAKKQNQVSIYDCSTGNCIPTGGTGV